MDGSMAWAMFLGVIAGALPAGLMRVRASGEAGAGASSEWVPLLLPKPVWVGFGAAAGLTMGARFDHSAAFPAYLAFAACATPLAAIDLASTRIPDRILGPSAAFAIACFVVALAAGGGAGSISRALVAALAVGSGFVALALVAGGGFGLGDCKLLAFIALMSGYQSWVTVTRALFAGLAIAALAGLIARRLRGSRQVPLAPWLIAGALIVLVL